MGELGFYGACCTFSVIDSEGLGSVGSGIEQSDISYIHRIVTLAPRPVLVSSC